MRISQLTIACASVLLAVGILTNQSTQKIIATMFALLVQGFIVIYLFGDISYRELKGAILHPETRLQHLYVKFRFAILSILIGIITLA